MYNCFFSSRRRHTRVDCDWSSDVCSSDLSRSYGHSSPLIAGFKKQKAPLTGAFFALNKRPVPLQKRQSYTHFSDIFVIIFAFTFKTLARERSFMKKPLLTLCLCLSLNMPLA